MCKTRSNNNQEPQSVEKCGKKCESFPFEEALKLTGIGKYNYGILLVSVYSLLAAAAELFSAGIIVASAQCDLDLDVYKKGIIGSVPMLGVVCTAHLWGFVADTRGRKFSLIVTTTGTILFAAIASFSNHWVILAVMKLCAASFASGTNAVTYALLGEQTPLSHRCSFLLFTSTGVFLSQAFNSVFAYPILNMTFAYYLPGLNFYYRPWRLLTLVFGLISVVNLLVILFYTFESPKYYFAKGENEKGLEMLRNIFAVNSGKSPEEYSVKEVVFQEKIVNQSKSRNILVSMWNQTTPLFHKENLKNTLLISYLCIAVYSVGPPMVIWLPMIYGAYSEDFDTTKRFCEIIQYKSVDAATNATDFPEILCNDTVSDFTIICLCFTACIFTVLSVIANLIVKCTSKKLVIIWSHILGAVLGICLNFVYNIGAVVLLVGMTTGVVSMGMATAYAIELFPTYLRATGVSVTMMVGRAASFFVIALMGSQLQTNCQNFIYFMAALIFSCSLAAFFLPSDKKPNKEDLKTKDVETVMDMKQ